MTAVIVAANCWIFAHQAFHGPALFEHYVRTLGLVPSSFVAHLPSQFYKVFTAMFMHGGFFHLLGNMWFLWIFGDNVEERMGKIRFLFFYVLTGAVSFVTHVVVN